MNKNFAVTNLIRQAKNKKSETVRQLIKIEKPDALFIITDPRYFDWLFRFENEIR